MPKSFRERVDVTSIIRSILDSYPLGNGILRELLQNSDDAAATEQTFILDLRNHPIELLVDPELVHSQGPALLAVNNSRFTEADWIAIRTIHNSSKTQDEKKIGKFGIGVRACYHLTDNPHFLSGSTLGIFDPHDRFFDKAAGGLEIDLVKESSQYPDQLGPFADLLDSTDNFPGTIVRLPLRSAEQASRSNIKQTSVDAAEIVTLFQDFVEKELSVVMLFLKHIRSIRLKVINSEGIETFIGGAEIPDLSISEKRAFFPHNAVSSETFKCTINVETPDGHTSKSWRIFHSIDSPSNTSAILKGLLGYDVETELLAKKDKLFPHIALAFPINQDEVLDGRLFTLLPLPIYTRFPVHVHAILALTQDRQSLRNIEEVGTGSRSRERFLVTWNQAVFQEFLPAAWSRLLRILIAEGELENVWLAWPTSDHVNDYWNQILPNLTAKILASDLAVFPKFGNSEAHVALSSGLVASPSDNTDVLMSLSRVGLSIVRPPPHIQDVLRAKSDLLHPNSVRNELLSRIPALTEASDEDKNNILQYLVLHPGSVSHVIGLPLVPLISGRRISLSEASQNKYTLVTEEQEKVFGIYDADLVPLSKMSAQVSDAFCSSTTVNVILLDAVKVHHFLQKGFEAVDPLHATLEDKVQWLTQFWAWMFSSTWKYKADLLKRIDQLHLLPTSRGPLRQLRSRVPLPVEGPPTLQAWSMLGAQFLHPDFIPYQSAFQHAVVQSDDVAFLVDTISPDLIPTLDKDSAQLIQTHIVRCLSSLKKSLADNPVRRGMLMRNFIQLPIFPTRVVDDEHDLSALHLHNASKRLVYIRCDNDYPVPAIPDLTFFDVAADGGALRDIITSDRQVLSQVGVLEMAIDYLDAQAPRNYNALLTRIIQHLPILSGPAKTKLQSVAFISVIGASGKVPPNQVIDPGSELEIIFNGEHGKLPDVPWGTDYLAMLTSQGFFLRELTPDIVSERIRYFSAGSRLADDTSSGIFVKAKWFLMLLDKRWDSISQTTNIAEHLSAKWLPTLGSSALGAPNGSRDHKYSQYLFDLVLPMVDVTIRNERLRTALGWGEIPISVLMSQLRKALVQPAHRLARLTSLIKEFSRRFSDLSATDLDSLKHTVSGHRWVPVSRDTDIIVETKYALLQSPNNSTSRFSPTSQFKGVMKELLDGNGRAFLTVMGCLEKPCLDTLFAELKLLARHPPTAMVASQAVGILTEIDGMISDSDIDDHSELWVPGTDFVLRPISEVYFEDTLTDFRTSDLHPAHSTISRAVARNLKISFLSTLELGDEDEDMQMGEVFTSRVRGVLDAYDIQYALNEYLANAVDAKATEFSVILDERTFESSRVFTKRLGDLQRTPSLFLFNNAVVKPEDFHGLRMVGQGGKGSDPDTIGRYGLGALSLFHFADVVQLISGDSLLILDPSGDYLPPLKGKPRTALKMRLADVSRRYPDHLSCFDSLHGFSKSDSYYEGTLFRLPLRNQSSRISSTQCSISSCLNLLNGPYHGLAKDAMYFTPLEQVSAGHRGPLGEITSVWSISASRTTESVDTASQITTSTLRLDHQKWLITKSVTPLSEVPAAYRPVLAEMKLDTTRIGLVVRMAFPLGESGISRNHLFSSLRLPIKSSLPAHIHAQFSLSSDRRHIRFEPPDGSGLRLPQAAYNHWILSTLVAPLYISSINHVPKSLLDVNSFAWWPTAPMVTDDISRTIIHAFYELLPASLDPMCHSVTGSRIAPMAAKFCGSETSPRIIKILRFLESPNVVHLSLPEISSLAFSPTAGSHLPVVDPTFVKEIIKGRRAALATLFANKQIGTEDIDAVLLLLLKGDVPVGDVPLFIQEDRLVCVNTGAAVLYAPPTRLIPVALAIFPPNRFIRVGREAQELLFGSADLPNVRPFDETGVITLLKEQMPSTSRCPCTAIANNHLVANFWSNYERLPGPPQLSSLENLPLIATTNGEYLSAVYCRDGSNAILQPATGELDGRLIAAMESLDVVFYRLPPPFAASHAKTLTLETCIRAIQRKSDRIPSAVNADYLCNWIRDRVYFCADADRGIVSSLPIWEALRGGEQVLLAASEVEMLPFHTLDLENFANFVRPAIALARYSLPLETVIRWSPTRQAMSSIRLAEILDLPHGLNDQNREDYSRLLNAFLTLQDRDWRLPVPDGNLVLRPISEFYDHSNPLFSEVLSLEWSDLTLFLHPSFRHLSLQLRSKGLKVEVDWNSFLRCARCIQTALAGGQLPDNDLVAKATIVYTFYNSNGCRLPLEVMADPAKWDQLSRIPFIPRAPERSTAFSFNPELYCVPLPVVASPAQVVRQEYEQVAWTQRARFQDQPGRNLATNPLLGVPRVEEVVSHLIVLATRIAQEHTGDHTLLEHLQATYRWLNGNNEEARLHLLLATDLAIFLNVDDPLSEVWEWRSAKELLFDIEYDWPETNTFRARKSLQDYRPLLLAAGAGSEHAVEYRPRTTVADGNTLREAFDGMRRAGQLTDVVLLPSAMEDVEVENLRAHSAFLGAAIPHVRDGLLGWREGTSESKTYSFPGSYFGARAVLDFIYTGKIEPNPGETGNGHMDLLRDLLELLRAADEWNMPELRDEIGRLVKEWRLLSRDTYQIIVNTAKEYQATSLLDYCREWGDKNPAAVRRNGEDEEEH
ncbi:hypothetical protein C8F04DRAFT_1239748 [Mycena alexandri]|uniref:BTB domain-containing protein n=1 Tax=Mycena alexandri TaxID=1745969 RepID=A0AAD6SAS7_9AGAR|nr:hypothetical protein C8F04DRAFT_1239748 [Mycena alexandri]